MALIEIIVNWKITQHNHQRSQYLTSSASFRQLWVLFGDSIVTRSAEVGCLCLKMFFRILVIRQNLKNAQIGHFKFYFNRCWNRFLWLNPESWKQAFVTRSIKNPQYLLHISELWDVCIQFGDWPINRNDNTSRKIGQKILINSRLIESTWKILKVGTYKTYTNLTNLTDWPRVLGRNIQSMYIGSWSIIILTDVSITSILC